MRHLGGLVFNSKSMKEEKEYTPCCEVFPKIATQFSWFVSEGRTLFVMPNIDLPDNKFRVNYCPSCGAEIRSIKVPEKQFNQFQS